MAFYKKLDFSKIDWLNDPYSQMYKIVMNNFVGQFDNESLYNGLIAQGVPEDQVRLVVTKFQAVINRPDVTTDDIVKACEEFITSKFEVDGKNIPFFSDKTIGEVAPIEVLVKDIQQLEDLMASIEEHIKRNGYNKDTFTTKIAQITDMMEVAYAGTMVDIATINAGVVKNTLVNSNLRNKKSLTTIDAVTKYNEMLEVLLDDNNMSFNDFPIPLTEGEKNSLKKIYENYVSSMRIKVNKDTIEYGANGTIVVNGYSDNEIISRIQKSIIKTLSSGGTVTPATFINQLFSQKNIKGVLAKDSGTTIRDRLEAYKDNPTINSLFEKKDFDAIKAQIEAITSDAELLGFLFDFNNLKDKSSESFKKIKKSKRGLKTPVPDNYAKIMARNYMDIANLQNPAVGYEMTELANYLNSLKPIPEEFAGVIESINAYNKSIQGYEAQVKIFKHSADDLLLDLVREQISNNIKNGAPLLDLGLITGARDGIINDFVTGIIKQLLPKYKNKEDIFNLIKENIGSIITGSSLSLEHDNHNKELLKQIIQNSKKIAAMDALTTNFISMTAIATTNLGSKLLTPKFNESNIYELAQELSFKEELILYDEQREYDKEHKKVNGTELYIKNGKALYATLMDRILDPEEFQKLTSIQQEALKQVFKLKEDGSFDVYIDPKTGKELVKLAIEGFDPEQGPTNEQIVKLLPKLIKCNSIFKVEDLTKVLRDKNATKEEKQKAQEELDKMFCSAVQEDVVEKAKAKASGKPAKPIWSSPKAKYEYYCDLLKRLNSVRVKTPLVEEAITETEKEVDKKAKELAEDIKKNKIQQATWGLIYKSVQEKALSNLTQLCKKNKITLEEGKPVLRNKTLANCVSYWYAKDADKKAKLRKELAATLGIEEAKLDKILNPIVRAYKIVEKTGVVLEFDDSKPVINKNGYLYDAQGNIITESMRERMEIAEVGQSIKDGADPKLGTQYRIDIAKVLQGHTYEEWETLSKTLVEAGIEIFDKDGNMKDISTLIQECQKIVADPNVNEEIKKALTETILDESGTLTEILQDIDKSFDETIVVEEPVEESEKPKPTVEETKDQLLKVLFHDVRMQQVLAVCEVYGLFDADGKPRIEDVERICTEHDPNKLIQSIREELGITSIDEAKALTNDLLLVDKLINLDNASKDTLKKWYEGALPDNQIDQLTNDLAVFVGDADYKDLGDIAKVLNEQGISLVDENGNPKTMNVIMEENKDNPAVQAELERIRKLLEMMQKRTAQLQVKETGEPILGD